MSLQHLKQSRQAWTTVAEKCEQQQRDHLSVSQRSARVYSWISTFLKGLVGKIYDAAGSSCRTTACVPRQCEEGTQQPLHGNSKPLVAHSQHDTGAAPLRAEKPHDGWSQRSVLLQHTRTVCWLWTTLIWDFISFHFGCVTIARREEGGIAGPVVENGFPLCVFKQQQRCVCVVMFHYQPEMCPHCSSSGSEEKQKLRRRKCFQTRSFYMIY